MRDLTAIPERWKTALVILAAGHLIWTMVMVGSSAYKAGQLEADVELESYGVSHGTNITSVHLRVTNEGTEPIEPVFRVPSNQWAVKNAWIIVAGPDILEAGESAWYVIAAPGERAWIRPAKPGALVPSQLVILVQDGQRRAAYGPVQVINNSSAGGVAG